MRATILLQIASVLALAVAAVPASAQFGKPSQGEQLKLGKRAADEIRHKEKVLPSTDPRVILVRRVGQRLLSTFSDKKAPWEY